jgi:hypothetical protein
LRTVVSSFEHLPVLVDVRTIDNYERLFDLSADLIDGVVDSSRRSGRGVPSGCFRATGRASQRPIGFRRDDL